MSIASERLAGIAAWLDRSSKPRRSPMGHRVPTGRYAEILPWDFNEPPTTDYHANALPLFCPSEQLGGLALPDVADVSNPASQQRAYYRLNHLVFMLGNARLHGQWPGHSQAQEMPLCAIIALTDPETPLWAAVDAAGASLDLDTVPLLCAPLFAFSAKERADALARQLPFIP